MKATVMAMVLVEIHVTGIDNDTTISQIREMAQNQARAELRPSDPNQRLVSVQVTKLTEENV